MGKCEGETYKAELDLKNTTDTSPCLVREKAAALKTNWLADKMPCNSNRLYHL